MTRRPLDPLSLVLGLAVLLAGAAAISGRLGELLNRPAALVPVAIGLVGLALIGSARHRPEERAVDQRELTDADTVTSADDEVDAPAASGGSDPLG